MVNNRMIWDLCSGSDIHSLRHRSHGHWNVVSFSIRNGGSFHMLARLPVGFLTHVHPMNGSHWITLVDGGVTHFINPATLMNCGLPPSWCFLWYWNGAYPPFFNSRLVGVYENPGLTWLKKATIKNPMKGYQRWISPIFLTSKAVNRKPWFSRYKLI